MILDVVDSEKGRMKAADLQAWIFREKNYSRWLEHPSSSLVHHDDSCCEEARMWFLAFARSMEGAVAVQNQLRPPGWLSQQFQWGPSTWPISWCQVFKEKTIDCGVFAALAREIFKAQGFKAYPAQALFSYNETCTDHWKSLWQKGRERLDPDGKAQLFPWVGDQIVYHEVCLIEGAHGSEARLYDSTFSTWLEPVHRRGFGALLAVRSECPRILKWGDQLLIYGEWIDL